MIDYHRRDIAILQMIPCIVLFVLANLISVLGMNAEENVFTRIDACDGLSDNQVYHILQLDDGRMAITTDGNINIYDGASFTYVHYNPLTEKPLPGYHGAYHVYSGQDGLVWIKNHGTLRCFDLKEQRYQNDMDSLLMSQGADISRPDDLFFDRYNNMWTVKDGVIYDVTNDNRPYALLSDVELQDIESRGDTLLLFYSSGVMEAVDRQNSQPIFSTDAYSDPTAYRGSSLVKLNASGDLYQIRTDFNQHSIFLRYTFATNEWKEIMKVPYILHTFDFLNDSTAYITGKGGLLKVGLLSDSITPVPYLSTSTGSIPTKEFNTIHIDNQGGTWIGTYFDGVLYCHPARRILQSRDNLEEFGLTPQQLTPIPSSQAPSFYKGRVNCVLHDSNRLTWIGTPDGIKIFNDSALVAQLYAEDGLSNNNIVALTEDRQGNVWAATGNGLNLIQLTPDKSDVKSFDSSRGALSSQYLTNGTYYSPDGAILFKGRTGWSKIPSDSVRNASMPLNPLITRVESDSLSFLNQSSFSIPYDYKNLNITVASLNYFSPETTRFYMRLYSADATNDTTWREVIPEDRSGVLKLSLPHLSPDKYSLEVKACANESSPKSNTLKLSFTVTPPWWKSTAAYAVYAVLAALIVILIILLYLKAQKKRLMRRHDEEKMLMRITGLIERCNYYEQRIAEESTSDSQEERASDTLSEEDRQFIAHAVELVEASMGKGGYNVEQLSRELCMERTGLYKRMTALLDKSPSAFIKGIRLNHAARLVTEGKMSMAEVAEYTGFSSSSYMSRCFVEQWGCTPLEYAKTHTSKKA